MQFTTIVAVFFLDLERRTLQLHEAARAAGMTGLTRLGDMERAALGFHDPGREIVAGDWGAFGDAWAIVDDFKGLRCLQLYASLNSYLDAQLAVEKPGGAGDDWLLPYVSTFRDACLALDPVAAFLDTRAHYGDERWENKQGNRDWVLSQARIVAASSTNDLADERYSLLYLGARLARLWSSNPIRDDRDFVEVPHGRLVFARSGPSKMA